MGDSGGVRPPTIIALPQHLPAAASFRPGQTLQGIVQGTPDGLVVQVAGVRVPIESGAALEAGQSVLVEAAQSEAGLVLRLTPLEQAGTAPTPEAAAGARLIQSLLAPILESLGAVLPEEAAARLLPANAPLTETTLQRLVSLFVSRATMGPDLRHIAALLSQAAAAGAIPPDVAEEFSGLAARFVLSESGGLPGPLEAMARAGAEAQIAQAIASGAVENLLERLESDLRAQVSRLRGNAALARFLRGLGQLRSFENAVARILDRLDAAQLQNLRTFEQPYLFIEVPCDPDGALRHFQVHFFNEGRGKRRAFDWQNATVAIDLSMTRLGNLWISVKIVRGRCSCWFRATRADVVQAIENNADELAAALDRVGYPNAEVKAMLWDGNRLETVANLMRRFAGFSASV